MKQRDRIKELLKERFNRLIYDPDVNSDKIFLPAEDFRMMKAAFGKEMGKMKRKLLIQSVYVGKKWYWKWDTETADLLRKRANINPDLTKRRIRKKADSKTDFD